MRWWCCMVLMFPLLCFPQRAKQWNKLGEKAFENGDYYGASIYYGNSLKMDSSQTTILYQRAQAYRKYNNYHQALLHYTHLIEKDSSHLFPEALFYKALMLKQTGHYLEAGLLFTQYNDHCPDRGSYFYKKSKHEIAACDFALKLLLDTAPITWQHLDAPINTVHSEISPHLKNDNTLQYAALIEEYNPENFEVPQENQKFIILESSGNGHQWNSPTEINALINHPGFHNANGQFNQNKSLYVFSRCEEKMGCNLYSASVKNNAFLPPTALDEVNMQGYSSTQAHFVNQGGKEYLFFASDRPLGKGGMDLWYSEIKRGKYTPPRNLGNKINTPGNELCPFIDPKGTLYFSSDWHLGLGGYDIFSSQGSKTRWDIPKNIGIPYNSPANDLYYTQKDSLSGYWVSNREGSFSLDSSTCCNDIYFFSPKADPPVDSSLNKEVTLKKLNSYLPITLYFHNDQPMPKSWDTTTTLSYTQTFEDYFDLMDTYIAEYSKGINDSLAAEAKENMEDFFYNKAEKGVNDLNIFTKILLRELNNGHTIDLSIKGYASPLAKSDYNINLTLRRINTLINYLKAQPGGLFSKAIEEGRLKITKIPFGEFRAEKDVSDNLNDQRNSVYSIKAAMERKIEILSVSDHLNQEFADSSHFPALPYVLSTDTFDFGIKKQGQRITCSYLIKNTSSDTLQILNITADEGLSIPKPAKEVLSPGEQANIEVVFNSQGTIGQQIKTIIVKINLPVEKIKLTLMGTIKN